MKKIKKIFNLYIANMKGEMLFPVIAIPCMVVLFFVVGLIENMGLYYWIIYVSFISILMGLFYVDSVKKARLKKDRQDRDNELS